MKFRTVLIGLLIGSATIPLALVSVGFARRVSALVEVNALRELSLVNDRAAAAVQREFDLLLIRARTLGRDSDLQRAIYSVLFVGRAEELLTRFRDENALVSEVFLLDPNLQATIQIGGDSGFEYLSETSSALTELLRLNKADAYSWTPSASALFLLIPLPGPTGKVSGALVAVLPKKRTADFAASQAQPPTRILLTSPSWSTAEHMASSSAKFVSSASSVELNSLNSSRPLVQLDLTATEERAIRFQSVRSTARNLALITLATVFLVGIVSYFLARRMTHPLRALSEHVNEYGKGNFQAPPPEVSFEEFKTFVRTLTQMGSQIVSQIEARAEQERVRGEIARTKIEAELLTLRQQMQPHFLFNVLNNIGTLIPISPEKSTEMIADLSELYRMILEATKTSTIPLETELRIVELFLGLQKLRFGNRLTYSIEGPQGIPTDSPQSIEIPGLLIQTLVENAVKHGIGNSVDGGEVRIKISRVDTTRFECTVSNTGSPLKQPTESTPGTNTGLQNTDKRLTLLYGKSHGFSLHSFKESGTDKSVTTAKFSFTAQPQTIGESTKG